MSEPIERLRAIVSADCETQDCGHAAKWLAYRNPINPRSERYCVFCEMERLTRERDAARKALHEFGLDFRRVLHDARFLYGRCLAATIGVPKLDYLEEPEPQT